MMAMAQHSQQQQPHQSDSARQKPQQKQQQQQQLADLVAALQPQQVNNKTNRCQQEQQDSKRTLIKNQLYLIEQLQLENANLRNERDQLQLENEELKFQLQMISSSNILIQPNATFKNQQLDPLVESSNATKLEGNNQIKSGLSGAASSTSTVASLATTTTTQTAAAAAVAATVASDATHPSTQSVISNQVRILATPIRQPANKQSNVENQQVVSSATLESQLAVRSCAQLNANVDANKQTATLFEPANNTINIVVNNNHTSGSFIAPASKLISGKSTSLTEFNVKSLISAPQNRNLPHDDEEQRVKLVEQRYGGREKVQAAAIVIQRAFRKYQICKRFRTITEQLRHTYQTVNQPYQDNSAHRQKRETSSRPTSANGQSTTKHQQLHQSSTTDLPFASGTTRAAALESLSSTASRLAQVSSNSSSSNKQNLVKTSQQHVASATQVMRQSSNLDSRQQPKQDPVVAAAINFQQLESIRKRQYRVGLNIFNKNPEKGVSFLIAHSFIDSSSPFTKNSTGGYYHSNQYHFIDKHYLVQQQALPSNTQSCQLCCEEDNLKRNVAHFLLTRKGLAKEKIGQYLGNLQAQFNQDVLKYYLQELDFYGLQIDLALRKFLSTFRLPGEAQKIEKIVDCFSQRYVQCQQQPQLANSNNVSSANITQIQLHHHHHHHRTTTQTTANSQQISQNITNQNQPKNNLTLLSKDEIFILTFAIIMLNTDLHSPSLKPTSRMSAMQFVNNLRGVFKSQNINESDLIEIYERVKANQITTTPDHVTHVMKVQQGLTVANFQRKELPNLCVPHRRLVCFCRLFEVYDINKKERVGQHQREIFLFNDLLLVTKLARRVRTNTTQFYTYRQSISLQGLYVQLFQSPHYNFGIKLCQRSNDETIVMFNARNELDQSRFVDDLGESIAEMDEMETIKTNNISETIHFKYLERLKRHSIMHSGLNENIQLNRTTENDNHQVINKMPDMMNNCDTTRNFASKQISGIGEKQEDTVSNNTSSSGESRGIKTRFSSMLNLSSSSSDSKNDNTDGKHKPPKGLRQNKSFVNHPQLIAEQSGEPRPNTSGASSSGGVQRRCSTSSVHSLDSGLFLSRDVSPNQSS